jgi:hypothetical protein
MNSPRPRTNHPHRFGLDNIKWRLPSSLAVVALMISPLAYAQGSVPSPATPRACPIQFLRFEPSVVSVRVKNTSGKRIVGLVFMLPLLIPPNTGNGCTGTSMIPGHSVTSDGTNQ